MTIEDIKDITSFKWATVTAINPTRVKLDGDTAALALVPDSLIDPLLLAISDRVRVELSLRKAVIVGRSGGVPTLAQLDTRIAIAKPLVSGKINTFTKNAPATFLSLVNRGGFAALAAGSTLITIPKTGNYQLNFALLLSVSSPLYFKLLINGAVDYHGYTSAGFLDMRTHVARYLTSGTTIGLTIDNNDASPSSWAGNSPHNDFSVAFIGE